MKKAKNWIIKFWYYLYLDFFEFGLIKYKYLHLKKDILINFIEKKVRELAEQEGIKIFSVSYDELNKDEAIERNKIVGCFVYVEGENLLKYKDLVEVYREQSIILKRKRIYPRIELTEKSDVFVFLHELGHYFLYKRHKLQSEEGANLFIEEFFDNYLPPFFKWIYQNHVKVRTKKEYKFSSLESYRYWKEYLKWIKKHEA